MPVLSFRAEQDYANALAAEADKLGITVAEYIRKAVDLVLMEANGIVPGDKLVLGPPGPAPVEGYRAQETTVCEHPSVEKVSKAYGDFCGVCGVRLDEQVSR